MADDSQVKGVVDDFAVRNPMHRRPGAIPGTDSGRERIEYLGWLAGRIAHDFNNLLTPIMGYTDLLLQKADPVSDIHGFLVEIRNASVRAAGIVEDLIATGRRQVVQGTIIDLNKAFRDLEGNIRDRLGIGHEMQTFLGKQLYKVNVDPQQLGKMIIKLIDNSIEALRPGGRITIATDNADVCDSQPSDYGQLASMDPNEAVRPGKYCSISFSDNGIGMTHETQSRIFDPFFTTKKANKGLGLSAVLGMVTQNLGYIFVKSSLDNGCTVRILLPAFPFQ